jgi:phage FluMu gp28-like protein
MIVIKSSALVLIEFQNEWLDENVKIHFLMKDNKVGLESAIANGRQVLTAARKKG